MAYIDHWLVTLGVAGSLAVIAFVLRFIVRHEARKPSTAKEKTPGYIV